MSRGVASRAVRAWTLVLVAALLVSGVTGATPDATDVQPAAQCGFADGESDPTVATHRHDFGEIAVSRTGVRTVSTGDASTGWDDAEPTVTVGGPDAGQFRARLVTESTTDEDGTLRVSFAPTAPGPKHAWVVVEGDGPTVHCLVGTAVVAGASKGGSESGGAGDGKGPGGRGASGSAAETTGSGGGKMTDAVRGFGREFVSSVTRGVVSVVTLGFARDAAIGAGAAWAAGDGLAGKALGVAGYTLSGIDPTAGLRNGLPAALAAWRAGDFEGAGRALFGVVESVVFTGAAAAGAWEGSKRARTFARDRRGTTPAPTTGVDRAVGPSTTDYRAFTASLDAVLSSGFGDDTREDGGETSVGGDGSTVDDDGGSGWAPPSGGAMPGSGTSPPYASDTSGGAGREITDDADHDRDRDDRCELA